MISDEGHLEKFSKIPSTPNRYRSENGLGTELECGGTYFATVEPDGRRRQFNSAGFLMSETNPVKPESSISLTWDMNFDDGTPRLMQVSDGVGRKLFLEYERYETIPYPAELAFSTNYGATLKRIRLNTT